MNTLSTNGMLLQYRRLNRKRTKPSPITLAYAFILSSGAAMLYLTVLLSHKCRDNPSQTFGAQLIFS